jgi:diguanylate cyclase (GGDEF)-like protein
VLVLIAGSNAASAQPVDEALEQRLDDYLAVNVQDSERAAAVITEIFNEFSGQDLPVRSAVRLRTYYADAVYLDQPERAQALVEEALAQATVSGDADAIAEAMVTQLLYLQDQEEKQQALILEQDIELLLERLETPRIRYFANQIVGNFLYYSGQPENALQRYLEAYDAIDDTKNEARKPLRRLNLSAQMARIQSDLNNYEPALEMVERGIRQSRGTDLEVVFLPDLLLLKGYIEGQLQRHEDSIATHEEAIRVGREFVRRDVIIVSLNNIGSTLNDQGKHQEALELYQTALTEIPEGEEADWGKNLLQFNIGFSKVKLGDHAQGLAMLEAALPGMREADTDSVYVETLEYVAEAYLEVGDYRKAVDVLLEQRELANDVFETQRQETLNELQTRYEAKEQATQIQLLEERNALQERVIENQSLRQKLVVLFVLVVLMGLVLLWQAWRAARRANLRLKDANKELKYQSSHDVLTGLLNRRSFQREMENRAKTGGERREQPYPDALLLLDVDYFKRINDNYGHAAGDMVLVELGRRLQHVSRSTDMVIRWGGEEILLFLRNMDPSVLPEYTQRVLQRIGEKPVKTDHGDIHVTATGGFIPLPFDELSEDDIGWEKALQIVDMALYLGKTQGRNRAIGLLELKVPLEEAREALEHDLGMAIDKDWIKSVVVQGPGAAEHL